MLTHLQRFLASIRQKISSQKRKIRFRLRFTFDRFTPKRLKTLLIPILCNDALNRTSLEVVYSYAKAVLSASSSGIGIRKFLGRSNHPIV
jgi:hypothetical protein